MRFRSRLRPLVLILMIAAAIFTGAFGRMLGLCGPFTDVAGDSFCPFVLEIAYLGITTGTSPTTYDPTSNVTRLQMAAFLARTVDRTLSRGSRRAALDQFWTTQNSTVLGLTSIGNTVGTVRSDGADLWATSGLQDAIARVRGSDGKLLETWTGTIAPAAILVAMGRVFVAGSNPGRLWMIDPSQPAGAVTILASNLANSPSAIAFDGARIWTANSFPSQGSVSIVTPGASVPWTVTTVTTGFVKLAGAVYDGANVWVTDYNAGTLLKLDGGGAILQTVSVGLYALHPVFDGTNLWVPAQAPSGVSVVRASTGAVLAVLTGNGVLSPYAAAFDGVRVLVTNSGGDSVSLWKAADLSPLGFFSTGSLSYPAGACSDGVNFWIALNGKGMLARF